jgi:hypothetical protein
MKMQAITTKYLSATNTKSSRIKAASGDGKNSITVGYDYALSEYDLRLSAAKALCAKLNISGDLIGGGVKTGYAFVFKG